MGASTEENPSYVQKAYGGDWHSSIYEAGQLGPAKLELLVDTGYIHKLLSTATFNHCPATTRGNKEPWVTTTLLANSSGLPVYGKVKLTGQIRNCLSTMEFLTRRLPD